MATTLDFDRLDASLRTAIPSVTLSSDVRAFPVDGVEPSAVVSLASAENVADVLAVAAREGAAVVPWGGGTHMSIGNPPAGYDLALDLRRLDRLVEYEPADLTVTVGAGMRLRDLQQRLAEHGQWLPLDPPVSDEATVGGVLAANVSGPSRARFGTARDLLIGIRFATPGGEIVHAGGRVVKNVAGYDLGKLQIGAMGTLGVIVEATFKVAPLPQSTRWVELNSDSAAAVMSICFDIRDLNLAVTGFHLTRATGESLYSLRVSCAAGSAAVERSVREIEGIAKTAGVSFQEDPGTNGGPAPIVPPSAVRVRCSVTPSVTTEALEALAGLGAAIESYPTAGIVYGAWTDGRPGIEALQRLRGLCTIEGRGALVLESAPPDLKRKMDVWGDPPSGFELMRNLKAQFDPSQTLNPGRFLGGL